MLQQAIINTLGDRVGKKENKSLSKEKNRNFKSFQKQINNNNRDGKYPGKHNMAFLPFCVCKIMFDN